MEKPIVISDCQLCTEQDIKRHDAAARHFLRRHGIWMPRRSEKAVRHLGRMIDHAAAKALDQQDRLRGEVLSIRRTLFTDEAEALAQAAALRVFLSSNPSEIAERALLYCDEVQRDSAHPIIWSHAFAHTSLVAVDDFLINNLKIRAGHVAQGNWAGLMTTLLSELAGRRIRGYLNDRTGDRDFRAAHRLARGINHLINGKGHKKFPTFLPLFAYETSLQRVELALACREPEEAMKEMPVLYDRADKLGWQWLRADVLRSKAESLIQLVAARQKSRSHLSTAESLLTDAESICKGILPRSPYSLPTLWERKAQLYYAQQLRAKGNSYVERCSHFYAQYPHLYQRERLRRVCQESSVDVTLVAPKYFSASLLNLYVDERLVDI